MINIGGFGSGRYAAGIEKSKQIVERYPSIDIKQFKKFLNKNRKTEYVNKSHDDNVVLIQEIVVDPEEMFIRILFKGQNDLIYLDKTACNYGGWRFWFHCPCCSKRVGKLFHGSYGFACRECYSLNYLSQQLSKTDSYYYNLQAIRIGKRLDPNFELDYSKPNCPPRPKYMKRVAYWRLCTRFYTNYNKGWSVFLKGVSNILSA